MPLVIYDLGGGHTYTHAQHTQDTQTYRHLQKSDYSNVMSGNSLICANNYICVRNFVLVH